MEIDEIVEFWKKSARLDRKTFRDLFRSKNYVGSLFFVHLCLEKILKGLVQKMTKKTPPFTHDLLILAKLAHIPLEKEQEEYLAVINTFNIKARYADYKFAFYKKATRPFVSKFCKIGEEMYQWFLNQY